MGHYYSEMQCQQCASLRCSCAPKPPAERYLFDAQFNVVPASRVPLMRQFGRPSFDSAQAAAAARPEAMALARLEADATLRQALAAHRVRVLELYHAGLVQLPPQEPGHDR